MPSRTLPDRPSLEQLRNQARELQKSRQSTGRPLRLGAAQRELAGEYGFPTWAALAAHVASLDRAAQLKLAIDTDDVARVRALLTDHPDLHRARMGYGGDGPLTWAAECRGMAGPTPERLAIVQLMLDLGADVHQGGDGPLMRAALNAARIPVMELLIRHGADVNALWHGSYPIVCAPCESHAPDVLRLLLDHGADPNRPSAAYGYPLDIAIGTYSRSPEQHACVDALVRAGARGKYRDAPTLAIHRGRLDDLAQAIDADPGLLSRRLPGLDYGATGGRRLDLRGTTLLHAAAEYGETAAVRLLLDRGADPNVRADVDAGGVGGQTPLFHAVTQYGDYGLDVARLLIERGADLTVRCRLPGHYDRPDDFCTVTPLGYAARFPFGRWRTSATIEHLVASGAPAGDVYAAARTGRTDELRTLLRAGESPNVSGPEGDSALNAALAAGDDDAARLLADAGAEIGLPEACRLGAAERVAALLQADPSQVEARFGDQSWTAAFYAAAANRTEVLAVLDRFRCSWRAKDDHTQRTPLHVAVERGHVEAAAWLLERGVPADIRQWTGETPLHAAARVGAPPAILELLKAHGADLDARAAAGTPLTVARRSGRHETADWLRAHGAMDTGDT